MIDHMDLLIEDLNADIERAARGHDPQAVMLLRTIHGTGRILALVILYEIHTIDRFETVQQFCSYARLVKSQHESAGKKSGKGWSKIGNKHLKWDFSARVDPGCDSRWVFGAGTLVPVPIGNEVRKGNAIRPGRR